jgi:hypothetical protein
MVNFTFGSILTSSSDSPGSGAPIADRVLRKGEVGDAGGIDVPAVGAERQVAWIPADADLRR